MPEVIKIKCLFWNINRKNLVLELLTAVLENDIDIVVTAEAEELDVSYFLSQLKKDGKRFEVKQILPRQEEGRILLLANVNTEISVYKEEKYFTAYKLKGKRKNILLIALHLTSALHCSESARSYMAGDTARTIEKLEESCNMEAEKEGERRYGAVVVGDFNLHPFSAGVIGAHGFHAILDADKALKESRIINGDRYKFYYNPMWNLMGKRGNALGTFYYASDQDNLSFYWYTFDQILLRPELIESFLWEEFQIIDCIGGDSLIRNHKIYSKRYSDHLPVKFGIV